jgi:hypothetical protein
MSLQKLAEASKGLDESATGRWFALQLHGKVAQSKSRHTISATILAVAKPTVPM